MFHIHVSRFPYIHINRAGLVITPPPPPTKALYHIVIAIASPVKLQILILYSKQQTGQSFA